MTIDPFSPRNLAAVFALGGLGTMMLAPEPSWHSVGIGLACLAAFGVLSLLPSSRPGGDETETAAAYRSGRRKGAERRAREAPPGPNPGSPGPPAPRGLNDPHPALFKGLRTRHSGTSR
ncbi:hypothetical protein ACLBWX_13340 [Methylobacterium sp. M6A4_1b]